MHTQEMPPSFLPPHNGCLQTRSCTNTSLSDMRYAPYNLAPAIHPRRTSCDTICASGSTSTTMRHLPAAATHLPCQLSVGK
jgi:hypothetical protein